MPDYVAIELDDYLKSTGLYPTDRELTDFEETLRQFLIDTTYQLNELHLYQLEHNIQQSIPCN